MPMDTNDAAKPAPARRSAAHLPPVKLVQNTQMHNDEDETDEADIRARVAAQISSMSDRLREYENDV
jgi:hypothetical protein